jgi:uncharacterized protein (TIGR00297 family)
VTGWAALLLAGGLGAAGAALGWLTTGGAVAAAAVGGAVFWGSGLAGGGQLALFFISGSALTYAGRRPVGGATRPAPGGRVWRQVVANGGWAGLGALLVPAHPAVGWPLLTGALAAAQADTWGTEIGRYSRRLPRLITSGRTVPAGTSGGVTLLGTAAGAVGAGLMGSLALLLGTPAAAAAGAVAGGLLGTVADSILGATLQARYRCPGCGCGTEQAQHRCGTAAEHVSGLRWIDNDVVNLLATTVGAITACAIAAVAAGT